MRATKQALACLIVLQMCVRTYQRRTATDRPNIVLFITDDQDIQLGSMECMKKTLRIFSDEGAEFQNGFATTPICCPSRTSMLSGLYVHNHHVHSNKDNCTGTYWREHLEPQSFGVYLSNSGYRTGYFGKYLNEYDGSYVPPGWNEWMALIKNSRFYNYTINYNGRRVKHGDRYHEDYFTDLIANDSVNFFKRSMLLFPHKPVLMVLSFPAPHGPEDPAPQYSTLFYNSRSHRTPSWNYAPNPDKQWLLRQTGKMEPVHVAFTDFLHRRRLQTLLSVDDAVEKLFREMKMFGELNNTYLLYTSDHGYHLGQFGLIKGKTLPYDFDVKVPFFARGPGVAAGLKVLKPVANIDIAPTILDIAGLPVPEHVDGRSFLPLLVHESRLKLRKRSRMVNPWRHTVLIERGIRPKLLKLRERLARQQERFSKDARIQRECGKPEFQAPCKGNQVWECRKNEADRWRIFKCRGAVGFLHECSCDGGNSTSESHLANERVFLKEVSGGLKRRKRASGFRLLDSSPLSSWEQYRTRSSLPAFVPKELLEQWEAEFFNYVIQKEVEEGGWYQGIFDALEEDFDFVAYENTGRHGRYVRSLESPEQTALAKDVDDSADLQDDILLVSGCVLFPNDTVSCRPAVYNSIVRWKQQKLLINGKIRILRTRLQGLKDIRKHLREGRRFSVSRRLRPQDSLLPGTENDRGPAMPVEAKGAVETSSSLSKSDFAQGCSCERSEASIHDQGHPLRNPLDYEISESMLMEWLASKERSRQEGKKGRRKPEANKRRKSKAREMLCNVPNLNCFTHDNGHWRTEPFWTLGPFCFCQNSYNNSYWCLRTVNETHNFLYCEFVTGFVSYYDMNRDPFQLNNVLGEVEVPILEQLSAQLDKLRRCKGSAQCEAYGAGSTRPGDP
uniref:Sulfatase N-terminal domain-containing protein n=1 Tax=Trichuris muris TaxID=70415 RepID=A0A5S6QW02_TRIMR